MALRARVQEARDPTELDLDRRRGSLLVRRGKGGRHFARRLAEILPARLTSERGAIIQRFPET